MLWIKAFHIISMITWFAGIFYLPRLFVYHAQASDTLGQDRFIVMEEKLYRIIMTPSAVITIIFGAVLVSFNPPNLFLQRLVHSQNVSGSTRSGLPRVLQKTHAAICIA